MRFKLMALILAAASLPAVARADSPHLGAQGSIVGLRGVGHVWEGAEGTYIDIDMPNVGRKVVGFIPFGDKPTFPQLARADGHRIAVIGVVGLDGRAMITMTDRDQLVILD